jgi:hypothetical protein
MPPRLRLVSLLVEPTGPRSLSHPPISLSLSGRHITTSSHPFVSSPSLLSRSSFRLTGLRSYATHKSTTPPTGRSSTDDLLHRLEDASRRKAAKDAFDGRESVGPFPLGVGPSGRRKAWRRWRELGLGGKRESTRCRRRRGGCGGSGPAVMAVRIGSGLLLKREAWAGPKRLEVGLHGRGVLSWPFHMTSSYGGVLLGLGAGVGSDTEGCRAR